MLGILKPDHVGDLVLSAPAIRFLASRRDAVRLFVAPGMRAVAAALFPAMDLREIHLRHLAKEAAGDPGDLGEVMAELAESDMVVCLRSDDVLNRSRLKGLLRRVLFVGADSRRHEARVQLDHLAPFFGAYDPDAYWPGSSRAWPDRPRRIGLCLGSGFPLNRWSLLRWTELGRALQAESIEVFILRTPREGAEVALLFRALGLSEDALVSCDTIPDLLARVADLDLIVASDGGAGHLCSLAAPVLTVAASVPFRRFAPFGRHHRVVSMDLPCSPCLGFHPRALNGCLSQECGYGIRADAVMAALRHPPRAPGYRAPLPGQAHLFFGVSHA